MKQQMCEQVKFTKCVQTRREKKKSWEPRCFLNRLQRRNGKFGCSVRPSFLDKVGNTLMCISMDLCPFARNGNGSASGISFVANVNCFDNG